MLYIVKHAFIVIDNLLFTAHYNSVVLKRMIMNNQFVI